MVASSQPTRFWLLKTEPEVFSIDDLERDGKTLWDGVRNYQARNYLRDSMAVGDPALIYHSNASPPGVAGLGQVMRVGVLDETAFDAKSPYFDPKSRREQPTWVTVEIGFVEKFPAVLPLAELRAHASDLDGLLVIRRGMRLSVQPVEPAHFEFIVTFARRYAAMPSRA